MNYHYSVAPFFLFGFLLARGFSAEQGLGTFTDFLERAFDLLLLLGPAGLGSAAGRIRLTSSRRFRPAGSAGDTGSISAPCN
jgi:hypothetical protein